MSINVVRVKVSWYFNKQKDAKLASETWQEFEFRAGCDFYIIEDSMRLPQVRRNQRFQATAYLPSNHIIILCCNMQYDCKWFLCIKEKRKLFGITQLSNSLNFEWNNRDNKLSIMKLGVTYVFSDFLFLINCCHKCRTWFSSN